jgi:hypothetical protein
MWWWAPGDTQVHSLDVLGVGAQQHRGWSPGSWNEAKEDRCMLLIHQRTALQVPGSVATGSPTTILGLAGAAMWQSSAQAHMEECGCVGTQQAAATIP